MIPHVPLCVYNRAFARMCYTALWLNHGSAQHPLFTSCNFHGVLRGLWRNLIKKWEELDPPPHAVNPSASTHVWPLTCIICAVWRSAVFLKIPFVSAALGKNNVFTAQMSFSVCRERRIYQSVTGGDFTKWIAENWRVINTNNNNQNKKKTHNWIFFK